MMEIVTHPLLIAFIVICLLSFVVIGFLMAKILKL